MDFLSLGANLLRFALLCTVAESIRRRDLPAGVNAVVSLLLALLPPALEATYASAGDIPEAASLWVATAGFLHVLGMLGLYETTSWWDHLTHTLSAAFVGALVYAAVLVGVGGSQIAVATGTIVLTIGVGVFWELLELVGRELGERFGVTTLLVYYGPRDTLLDLLFDLVGVLLVVGLDIRLFVPTAAASPATTRSLLGWSVALVAVGSVSFGLFVAWSVRRAEI